MRTKHAISELLFPRSWRSAARVLAVTAAFVFSAQTASSQEPGAKEQARVPTSHANVHATAGSGSALLVIVPKGTVLPIVGRQGEWVQVQLSPELRKTGIVIRWFVGKREISYRGQLRTVGDEDTGWMHDSTVEITPVEAP